MENLKKSLFVFGRGGMNSTSGAEHLPFSFSSGQLLFFKKNLQVRHTFGSMEKSVEMEQVFQTKHALSILSFIPPPNA